MSKNNAFIMNLRKIGKDLKKEGAIQKTNKNRDYSDIVLEEELDKIFQELFGSLRNEENSMK